MNGPLIQVRGSSAKELTEAILDLVQIAGRITGPANNRVLTLQQIAHPDGTLTSIPERIEDAIAAALRAAVAEEREACAVIVDALVKEFGDAEAVKDQQGDGISADRWEIRRRTASEIADAIRTRPPARPACAHDHPRGL